MLVMEVSQKKLFLGLLVMDYNLNPLTHIKELNKLVNQPQDQQNQVEWAESQLQVLKVLLRNIQFQWLSMLLIGAYIKVELSAIVLNLLITLFWLSDILLEVNGLSRTLGELDGDHQVILLLLQVILVVLHNMPKELFD
jgi:hypothetical protein